jgi:hypothetical protein
MFKERLRAASSADPDGKNCIGFALYMIGIDDQEAFYSIGNIERYSPKLRVCCAGEAELIGIEKIEEPGVVVHLWVVDAEGPNVLHERPTFGARVNTRGRGEVENIFSCSSGYKICYWKLI